MITKRKNTFKRLGAWALILALVLGLLFAILSSRGNSQPETTAEQVVIKADDVTYTLDIDQHFVTAEQFTDWYMENMAPTQPVTIYTEKGQASENASIRSLTMQTDPAQDWETVAKSGSGTIQFDLELTLPYGYVEPDTGDITATLTVTIEATQTTPICIESVTANGNTLTVTLSTAVPGLTKDNFSISNADGGDGAAKIASAHTSDGLTYTLTLRDVQAGNVIVELHNLPEEYSADADGSETVLLSATANTGGLSSGDGSSIGGSSSTGGNSSTGDSSTTGGSTTTGGSSSSGGGSKPDTPQTKILTISSVNQDSNGTTATLTVTLSQAIPNLTASNFTVIGTGSATVDSVSTSDSGKTYTLNLSNVVAGEVKVSLMGVNGYTYSAEGSNATVTLLATPTEVTVSVAVQHPNAIPTTVLTATLSEAVAGLQTSNFTVIGTGSATVDSVSTSDSGKTYTLNLNNVTAGEASVGLQDLPKGYKMAENGNSLTVNLRQVATAITNITQTAVNGGVTAVEGRQLQFAISRNAIAGTVEAGVDLNTAFKNVKLTQSFSTTYPTFSRGYNSNNPNHNGQYLLVAELEGSKITRFGQVTIQGVPERIMEAKFNYSGYGEQGALEGVSTMSYEYSYYVVLSAAPTSAELNQITTNSTLDNVKQIFVGKSVGDWKSFTSTQSFSDSMLGENGKCLFLVWLSNDKAAVYAYATK